MGIPSAIGHAREKEMMKVFKNPLKRSGDILDARAAFGSGVGEPGKMGEKGNEK